MEDTGHPRQATTASNTGPHPRRHNWLGQQKVLLVLVTGGFACLQQGLFSSSSSWYQLDYSLPLQSIQNYTATELASATVIDESKFAEKDTHGFQPLSDDSLSSCLLIMDDK